ncbi:DNA translocase FtsK [Alkalihalobacillus sp. BA299]|uniref:DNA translocase FtsK n=1 Tax=Alkalihalobacillus sp. BA299 TaxID=2815938 RepID=UPI001AD9F5FA|nr:DNA translocase FtsK [Alkalihalobacillus sp. BA299]
MSIKVFIGIKELENIKIDTITKAIEEKYAECQFDQETQTINARQMITTNQYGLIIVDNKVLPTLKMYENKDIPCSFLYICPSYKEAQKKNLIVFNDISGVLTWINKLTVTNEELAQSLGNDELIKGKKNKNTNQSNQKEENKKETTNPEENNQDKESKNEVKRESNKENVNDLTENSSQEQNNYQTSVSSSVNNLDDLYNESVQLVIENGKASINMLQKELKISFQEGSTIMERMEQDGIVGPRREGKYREILVKINDKKEDVNESLNKELDKDLDQERLLSENMDLASSYKLSKGTYDLHRTIGVWSPQGGKGTTTFIMNFAMYLGRLGNSPAVIEGISNKQQLKTKLLKFTKETPPKWESWASQIFKPYSLTEKELQKHYWVYNNVSWYPLDYQDPTFKWDTHRLFHYINVKRGHNTLFIDFPGGYMDERSMYTLNHSIDELWVVMDNDITRMKELKKYIQKIVGATDDREEIPAKLLCLQELPSSNKSKDYAKELGLPLLASCPYLGEVVQRNLNQEKPLLEQSGIIEKVQPSYEDIRQQIQKYIKEPIILKKKPLLAKIKKLLFRTRNV